jgi:hypothetical protein
MMTYTDMCRNWHENSWIVSEKWGSDEFLRTGKERFKKFYQGYQFI